jgi:hypothetical protein
MDDLPANVTFPVNPDGWHMDQDDDLFESVQAFLEGDTLTVELWGTTTLLSPADKAYRSMRIQQKITINLRSRSWNAERSVFDVIDETGDVADAIDFTCHGVDADIPGYRRV